MWLVVYGLAAGLEILGCFAVWAVLRQNAPPWWLVPGAAALIGFAWVLTLVQTEAAGRAFAGYGGIYIVASLVWLAVAEGVRLDRFDLIGAALCLAGAAVIALAPRA